MLAVQERPLGTADAVRAAVPQIAAADTVVVINGDVPLITADDASAALVEDHERPAPPATIATMVLDDPTGYGRVVRAPDGTVERVVETKAPATRPSSSSTSARSTPGVFAFDGGRADVGARRRSAPTTPRASTTSPTCCRSCARTSGRSSRYELADPDELLQINDRVPARRGHRGRAAPDPSSATCSPA